MSWPPRSSRSLNNTGMGANSLPLGSLNDPMNMGALRDSLGSMSKVYLDLRLKIIHFLRPELAVLAVEIEATRHQKSVLSLRQWAAQELLAIPHHELSQSLVKISVKEVELVDLTEAPLLSALDLLSAVTMDSTSLTSSRIKPLYATFFLLPTFLSATQTHQHKKLL